MTYTDDKTFFSAHDLDACPTRKQLMRKVISGEKIRRSATLGMKGRADPYANDVAEFMLPAGHKLAVLVGSSKDVGAALFSSGYYCSVGFLLTPSPDADYEVQLQSSSFGCRARVFKLVETPSNDVTRARTTEAEPISANAESQLCAYK